MFDIIVFRRKTGVGIWIHVPNIDHLIQCPTPYNTCGGYKCGIILNTM